MLKAHNNSIMGFQAPGPFPRDWERYPAIVERETSADIVAIGDVHGSYDRLVGLLLSAGLITIDLKFGFSWSGGNRIFICTGDLIDKGSRSLDVLNLMIMLQSHARDSGGEVVVTLGNHEAEFLADPDNRKAEAFRGELQKEGIDPHSLQTGDNRYGEWLRNLPFAARINDWFFSHAGNTSGKSIPELAKSIRHAVKRGQWDAAVIAGCDSLIESRKWWLQQECGRCLIDDYLRALDVNHIVFGHDPTAFSRPGEIGHEEDGRIFLIDVGMTPAKNFSPGALLRIEANAGEVIASSFSAEDGDKELWRGRAQQGYVKQVNPPGHTAHLRPSS